MIKTGHRDIKVIDKICAVMLYIFDRMFDEGSVKKLRGCESPLFCLLQRTSLHNQVSALNFKLIAMSGDF